MPDGNAMEMEAMHLGRISASTREGSMGIPVPASSSIPPKLLPPQPLTSRMRLVIFTWIQDAVSYFFTRAM